jgi:arylsulfatase A-like enzyme
VEDRFGHAPQLYPPDDRAEPQRDFDRRRLLTERMPSLVKRGRCPRAVLIACAALVALSLAPEAAPAAVNAGGRPNVVVISSDDQPRSLTNERVMPNTMRLLAGPGTTFTDFIATTPLCCPSRASLLTGQYAHNHGVLRNSYSLLDEKGNTLPAWLRAAGYTTIHVGKYLNGYREFADPAAEPAPGWTKWFTMLEPNSYYDYTVSRNGSIERFGHGRRDHLTNLLGRQAASWAKRFAKRDRPIYLQLDHYAPHKQFASQRTGGVGCKQAAVPGPNDAERFADEPLPGSPSFDELDVSDKPPVIAALAPFSPGAVKKITTRYRCAAGAMRTVDRSVERIRRALKGVKEWGQTVVLFTSDNGFFYGEHRLPGGKEYPYEENLHVPLIARVPPAFRGGAPQVPTVEVPTANIDIAPTILELAGAEPCAAGDCRVMDGRSLLGLIGGADPSFPEDRMLVIEQHDCNYRGIRGGGYVLLEHQESFSAGRCVAVDAGELYDLEADPFQLQNLYGAPRRSDAGLVQQRLEARLAKLQDCSGIPGRDPAPANGQHCE